MFQIVLLCREGFEPECAAEIQSIAEQHSTYGYCRARTNQGFVQFFPSNPDESVSWPAQIKTNDLIFARQLFVADHDNSLNVGTEDRVSAIVEHIKQQPHKIANVLMQTADTNDGRELSVLAKKLLKPLQGELKNRGLWQAKSHWNLYVLITHTDKVIVGINHHSQGSQWPNGIPRLKRPRQAPSRSTLKLEEAIKQFGLEKEFKQGMTGVDLGAAPGGWTYQLVRREIKVYAIDNGPLTDELNAHPLVQHIKADGFKYRPSHQVDWLVCDMVEKPSRVMELMIQWLVTKTTRSAIFNLKLPMKKRFAEVTLLMKKLRDAAEENAYEATIKAKHLYHDREEITIYCKFNTK